MSHTGECSGNIDRMKEPARFSETEAYREGIAAVRSLEAESERERSLHPTSAAEVEEAAVALRTVLERHVRFMETFTPYIRSLRAGG